MNRRTKIISLAIISLVVILLLIWYIMLPQAKIIFPNLLTSETPLDLPKSQIINKNNNANVGKVIPQTIPEVDLEVTLKSLASSFGERYGSFSNQSDFKNLRDLQPLMTERFVGETIDYIKNYQSLDDSYYGVTSKTLKTEVIEIKENEGLAEIRLTMQKKEAKETMNQNIKITYQKMVINLQKENGKWRVDNAVWQ
jgi:hypothetical protein